MTDFQTTKFCKIHLKYSATISDILRVIAGATYRISDTLLSRLWRESSLNASLTSEKPITVFIPSDDSFSNNGFKKLIKNSTLSDIFVRRHILNEPLCEFDIHHHPSEIRIQTYVNLNGEVLRPVQHGDDIFIDGAKIEESEIVLSNGVAYILDSTISRDYISIQPDINRRTGTNLLNIISSH
ncbi:fasciclin domain protein [Dictyocaulus viviparus]|uniref:Fasciclin domain protein n=1 Tax=Dictyocaulus viviparus TaxID=29172 RepID=A0A0D8Y3E4_DICVI|nr:fasciclin domain protein [Dictyocaulus viviparus]